MEAAQKKLKIAIIGGGVAGISAAHMLSRIHDVSIFEKNDYLGGHTNTIEVETEDNIKIPIDTGFIVCNPTNYPNFYKFLNQLNVKLRDSDMCFGFVCEKSKVAYTGPAYREFIKQYSNFFKPPFLFMLYEQWRFNRQALSDYLQGKLDDISLGEYIKKLNFSSYFTNNYIIPLTAAIWSTPDNETLDFPAKTFIEFFNNHGMLELQKRPRWQTVVGGSHAYIKAFKKNFNGRILLNSGVKEISRSNNKVHLLLRNNDSEIFDNVIIAAHADQALQLLKDPSDKEKQLLGVWKYNKNQTVLHTDRRLMPKNKSLWASWNYYRKKQPSNSLNVTYYMNRLQGLKTKTDYFVSLNQNDQISADQVIYSTEYTHPAYDSKSVETQVKILSMNGESNTFYCGSYLGYGFHEDAVNSAIAVASQFGIEL